MTEKERSLIDCLAYVWNEYLKLPEDHPMVRQEFCMGIHVLQNIILARVGRREL